ncbi:glycosyltransferase [Blautia hydrogenotrophica]|uniref:glycosyltransferase n=2 Tax=Blautia hydrogenotrophica TaxID=53443 RepID=UPI0006BFC43F|nr:glycosyltransferase [Blautia hydrogenotrophica]MEE0461933.1 glycosyltransferase [Blautia hydrogenotrophica]CUM97332.1 Hyaluronan synthase [Blautia hydrogenotrophica]SCH90174.1 Hyaluronan synthase [uncultured Blautia sp.]
MPKISVLTSVYNESEKELLDCVDSILQQTFSDFEFILVNDNPVREELDQMLADLSRKDRRIKVLKNPKNYGLAWSMNRAAAISRSPYLARMDADDISEPNRLEEELKFLINNNCDLVCTRYKTINEQGRILQKESPFYTKEQIMAFLPYRNIIHHPTVLMKKSIFHAVGGYRIYPCAQDYDLWLRFLETGYQIEMLPQILLQYRVRKASTTGQRRYLQALTLNYMRKLYKNWKKYGKDGYSPENYASYLKRNGAEDPKKQAAFRKASLYLLDSQNPIHTPVKKILLKLRVFLSSGVYRKNFIYKIQHKLSTFR